MNPPNPTPSLHPNALKRPFLALWKPSEGLLKALWAVTLTAGLGAGCASAPERPVVVTVNDPPSQGGRFRTPERQRDVWIAPQAAGSDILQHDQTVTFVEKPAAWQLPSTLEPHTISKPDLPLERGEYDAEVVRRQKEILADTQAQVKRLSGDLEALQKQSTDALERRGDAMEAVSHELLQARTQAAEARQRLADMEAGEKAREEAEARKKAEKKWWQLWK